MRSAAVVIVSCLQAAACGGSPTAATPAGYAGQWSGTTMQGRPIAFTIDADEVVTSITLGHDFNGCSGSQTFSNLRLAIAPNVTCIPGPCSPSLQSYRAFSFGSGDRLEGPSTQINGLFPSQTHAEGAVYFRDFPGCGSALAVGWTATRR
jgi:hypothetical protein